MKKIFLNRENSKRISETFILNFETLLPKITAMLNELVRTFRCQRQETNNDWRICCLFYKIFTAHLWHLWFITYAVDFRLHYALHFLNISAIYCWKMNYAHLTLDFNVRSLPYWTIFFLFSYNVLRIPLINPCFIREHENRSTTDYYTIKQVKNFRTLGKCV